MIGVLLLCSAVLQIVVAAVALWAPRSERARAVWWAFSAGLAMMALERAISITDVVAEQGTSSLRTSEEALEVVVTLLFLLGTLRMRRLWDDADAALAQSAARERSAKESEQLWLRVFEFAPDGYLLLELDGTIVKLNVAAAEISGVPREGSEGRHIFELGILDEEGMALAARNLGLLQQGRDPGPAEYTFHRSDGTERQVEIIGYVMELGGREVLLTIAHDVTRRRRIETELRRSRLRLEEAQRVAGIVTFDLDLRSGRMWVTGDPRDDRETVEGRMQLTLDEALSFINDEDRERVIREIADGSQRGGRELVVEYRQTDITREGEAIVRTTARAETDEDGDVIRLIGATLDITDIREAEQEIRSLNAALEERVRARTAELERAVDELGAFSYSVSHDLRSPLRAMAGYSELVLEEEGERMSAASREHLQRVRASSIRMASLIDGLLSLSRLSRATRNDSKVNLSEIARGIVAELRASDRERQVDVVIDEGIEAVADEGMVSVVLQNLLSNAWKFTRNSAAARIAFGRNGHGEYFVKDNGVGFDATQKSKLFRPFERLHRTDEFEGTGIGLATVDRIVRHHGGRVWAEGSIGKGSTFWFTLSP